MKKSIAFCLFSVISASTLSEASNLSCVACELAARQRAFDSRENVLTSSANSSVDLGLNVASIAGGLPLQQRSAASPIQFWQPVSQPQLPRGAQSWWNGQGELPGGFQRPWEFPKTNFDPSFVTPYYTSATGPLNVPSAPWYSWMSLSPFVPTQAPELLWASPASAMLIGQNEMNFFRPGLGQP